MLTLQEVGWIRTRHKSVPSISEICYHHKITSERALEIMNGHYDGILNVLREVVVKGEATYTLPNGVVINLSTKKL